MAQLGGPTREKLWRLEMSANSNKVAIYCREIEKDALKQYARDRDWLIVREYVHGAESEGYDQFPDLLCDCQQRSIDTILTWRLFGRSLHAVIAMLEQIRQQQGIEFIAVEDGIDSSTEIGRLFFAHIAILANVEREAQTDKVTLDVTQQSINKMESLLSTDVPR
jgi:DNA invertase Pin-like site-specific DNA recombinase